MARITLMILMLVLSVAFAQAGTVTYKAGPKMDPVTFDHDAHKNSYVKSEGCNACHSGTPAKIDAFGQGKKKAHSVCYDCHKQKKISECAYCHK